ncbi:MAG: hypothetical protein JKY37_28175 [Nannocystaceae bacterium]|nr:hypothetical protein [Nannocystaceae bacterium]
MSRLFGLFLTSLLVLPACERNATVAEDVDALLAATADIAVFLCECTTKDTEACAEAAQDVLGDAVNECIEDVVAVDPRSQEVMRCSTTALRNLLDCYESAASCPEATVSGSVDRDDEESTTEEDKPISDDACALAFEDDIKACGELLDETQDALDECLPSDRDDAENCLGDAC